MSATHVNGLKPGFDLRRFASTSRGAVPRVDSYVEAELALLNAKLSRRVIGGDWDRNARSRGNGKGKAAAAPASKKSVAGGAAAPPLTLEERMHQLFSRTFTPRQVPAMKWKDDSLVDWFASRAERDGNVTLSDLIDSNPELAKLKYAFHDDLQQDLYAQDFGERTILDIQRYPAIVDLLLAHAYFEKGLEEPSAVKSFLLEKGVGTSAVRRYATVSAAREYLDERRKLAVPDIDIDDSQVVQDIADANIGLEADAFTTGVDRVVDNFVFNANEAQLIKTAETALGPLPDDVKPQLINFIKAANDKKTIKIVTPKNVRYYAANVVGDQLARSQMIIGAGVSAQASETDFDVEYFDDDQTQIQISRSAVKCAAQLFYAMTLGEEAELFNAVNFFTHRFLVRGSLTIEDRQLRDDLQEYVFSNRFRDPRTGRILDRTRPAERAMFYRQVFNYGAAQIGDDSIINQDFQRLWKVLMLEAAKYLERAQASFNPEAYVPRQGVMQAVEDIQYNLSTHCTGMSTVIAPLIAAEVSFVIKKILMHEEVMKQVAPSGGTWWRVLEKLIEAMKNERPRISVLYSKAKLGDQIVRAIADYDPAMFTQDAPFSDFIANVDRFITTQSILQDALVEQLKRSQNGASGQSEEEAPTAAPTQPAAPVTQEAASGDEWNF